MIDLEPIYAALLTQVLTANTLLSSDLKIVESGRWLKHWDDVPAASQPALFLKQGPTDSRQKNWGMPINNLKASVWVYWKIEGSPDQAFYPGKALNQFIKAISKALDPLISGEKQNLGGLVQHCFIDGIISFDEGVPGDDDQAVLVIPITMVTAI